MQDPINLLNKIDNNVVETALSKAIFAYLEQAKKPHRPKRYGTVLNEWAVRVAHYHFNQTLREFPNSAKD